MANICCTNVRYKGEYKYLNKIKQVIPSRIDGYDLLKKLNLPTNICTVGFVAGLEFKEDALEIWIDDRWSPQLKLWKELPGMLGIQDKVELSFSAEECGEGIYWKSNNYNESPNFYIDFCLGHYDDRLDADTEEDLIKKLTSLFNKELKTMEEWHDFLSEYNENNMNDYCYIREFETVEIDDLIA